MLEARAVVPSEYDLVLLARGIVGFGGSRAGAALAAAAAAGVPYGPPGSPEVQARVSRQRSVEAQITTACEELLRDALAQVWPALWRRGGTQPAASLAGTAVRRGWIWERHAPAGLAFSPATLRLLQWMLSAPLLVAERPRRGQPMRLPPEPLEEAALTLGDQVLIYLALDATSGSAMQGALTGQAMVRAAPLAWLGFADLFDTGAARPPAFESLCEGAGAIVVETLTPQLARRWRAVELCKRATSSPERLIAVGAAQDAVLRGFMEACDRRRRRDLAGFVIDASAPLLQREIAPTPARLDPEAPLSRRAAARVAAGALLRAVGVWAAWDQAHRGVRFIDDDYPAAQLLLARFEAIQASGAARAAAWLAELAALAPTAAASTARVELP